MKKNKKNQSVTDCNKVTNSNKKNVSNRSNNKVTNKSNNSIGFENESKSFQLDDNDEHSFELK